MNTQLDIKSHIIDRLYDNDVDIKIVGNEGKAVVDGYLVSFVWDDKVGFVENTVAIEKYVGPDFTDY